MLVAPALTMTASGEHAGFAGTLSIGTDVTAATIVELARSADWADGLVLVNGHGGNHEAIDRAVTTLHAEGRDVLAWWPATGLFDAFDAHAGRAETSMMLALRPDLVRVERAAAGETAPVAALMGRLRAGGVVAVSPNGVLGDPTGATATEGASLAARPGGRSRSRLRQLAPAHGSGDDHVLARPLGPTSVRWHRDRRFAAAAVPPDACRR